MSTLRVANLQSTAGTQTVTQDRLYRGAATAWVNFNGTGTVAIRDSYNVSSITDNGVGDYTVNFQTALANANYAANAIARRPDALLTGSWFVQLQSTATQSTGSFQLAVIFNSYSPPSVATDSAAVFVSFFGGY